MDKHKFAKVLIRSIVGFSAAGTVAAALRNNVPTDNAVDKTQVVIGSVACGMVASEAVGRHTDNLYDQITSAYRNAKETAEAQS